MYFWNVRALKRELVSQPLPESKLFGYFLAVLMVETALWQTLVLFPSEQGPELWDYLSVIGGLALTLGGTVLAYRMNGGAGGRNFLGRFFPLFWVLSVRFLVLATPVAALAIGAAMVADGWLTDPEVAAEEGSAIIMSVTVVTWVVSALFYYRLAAHMRDVARSA
jgi:hypothetical protein